MWLYGLADATVWSHAHTHGISVGSDYVVTMSSAGALQKDSVCTKIQFDFSSGNIAKGKFKLYGVS